MNSIARHSPVVIRSPNERAIHRSFGECYRSTTKLLIFTVIVAIMLRTSCGTEVKSLHDYRLTLSVRKCRRKVGITNRKP
jgi:hypothetical protein